MPQPLPRLPTRTPAEHLRRVLGGGGNKSLYHILPELRKDPWSWGIKVKKIAKLHERIAEDIEQYCSCHELGCDFSHLCCSTPCPCDHAGAVFRPKKDIGEESMGPMRGNMHLVVQRYVKPWTEPFEASYSAVIVADSAVQQLHTKKSLREECGAEVFISHCWNETFSDFLGTLEAKVDPNIVVWVCSLGIDQNVNIGAEISGDIFSCPFAKALRGAQRVLVLMDQDAEPLTRVWCVLEAHLAFRWGKPYDMALPPLADGLDERAWRVVGDRLRDLDMRNCRASHPSDKQRILGLVAESGGGVDELNCEVRSVSARASERAEVLSAAASGRLVALEAADDAQLASADARGRTAAHFAAQLSQVEVLRLLARRRADLAARDVEDRSPLSIAAEAGATSSIAMLLQLSDTVRDELTAAAFDVEGGWHDSSKLPQMQPLHFATFSGSAEVARLLLEARAHVQAYCKDRGATPLVFASKWRSVAIMEVLLQYQADVNEESQGGFLPLHHAATYVDSREHRGTGGAPLLDDEAAIQLLLRQGAVLDALTTDGRSPTFLAAQTGRVKALQALLDARADPSLANKKGFAPLHAAAENNHCKCLQLLAAARAELDQLAGQGSSPLKIAASGGWVRASAALLELRADPNAAGPGCLTALLVAIKKGKLEIARKLLGCRASPAARSREGISAAELAASTGQGELVAELLQHDAQLLKAPRSLFEDIAEFLAKFAGEASMRSAASELEGALGLGRGEAAEELVWAVVEATNCDELQVQRCQAAVPEIREWDNLLALIRAGLEALGPRVMVKILPVVTRRLLRPHSGGALRVAARCSK